MIEPRAAVHHRLLGGSAGTATRLTTVAKARNARQPFRNGAVAWATDAPDAAHSATTWRFRSA